MPELQGGRSGPCAQEEVEGMEALMREVKRQHEPGDPEGEAPASRGPAEAEEGAWGLVAQPRPRKEAYVGHGADMESSSGRRAVCGAPLLGLSSVSRAGAGLS